MILDFILYFYFHKELKKLRFDPILFLCVLFGLGKYMTTKILLFIK